MPTLWARCARPDQRRAVGGIADRLADDGDQIDLQITQRNHPRGRRELQAFFETHAPALILWIGGPLDAATLQHAATTGCPVILIDADHTTVASLDTGWFLRRSRLNLAPVRHIFALDNATAEALAEAGAGPAQVVGRLEEGPPILPYVEADRQDIAKALQTRPVWLARGVTPADLPMLIAAQRHASRRAHRLLLIIVPKEITDAADMAQTLGDEGLLTHCRSDQAEPDEATQVFLADLDGEEGLWLRIAPMVFVGGSFNFGPTFDPFEAAALGAVNLHGPEHGDFGDRFFRLLRAGASHPVTTPDRLGGAVEALLTADRVARMATAGWDVTSSGAELTGRIVSLIQDHIDGVGAA